MSENNEIDAEPNPCRCKEGGSPVREIIAEGWMQRPYRTRCVVCGRSGSFEKTPELADESWNEMMGESRVPGTLVSGIDCLCGDPEMVLATGTCGAVQLRCGTCGRRGPWGNSKSEVEGAWCEELPDEPWTPVEKGLPKINKQILCFLEDSNGNTFQGQGCWFLFGESILWIVAGMRIGEVGTWEMFAWKPLPAPYRAEENEGEES